MCITTIPQSNRTVCPSENVTLYYSAFESIMIDDNNCSIDDTISTSFFVTEMDANNNLHMMRFNLTGEIDFDDVKKLNILLD